MADRSAEMPSLRALYGDWIEIRSEGGSPVLYRLLHELILDGVPYAVMQTDAMRKEGDIEVFRVLAADGKEPVLETVEDDDEWERVAEAYDDLQFGSDERP